MVTRWTDYWFSLSEIDRYLGIDLVEEFLDVAQDNYPEYEFQLENFIGDRFRPKQPFTIVVALGVLVSRVRNYQEFVELIKLRLKV